MNRKDGSWQYANSINEAVSNADAIIIMTEWNEFKSLNIKIFFTNEMPLGYLIQEVY